MSGSEKHGRKGEAGGFDASDRTNKLAVCGFSRWGLTT